MAFGTPTWLPVSPSLRPGLMTRPVKRVGSGAALQSGMAEQVSHASPPPATHCVGPLMPPVQISPVAQVRPSLAQSMTVPHTSTVYPHAQPSSAQVCGPHSPPPRSMKPPEPDAVLLPHRPCRPGSPSQHRPNSRRPRGMTRGRRNRRPRHPTSHPEHATQQAVMNSHTVFQSLPFLVRVYHDREPLCSVMLILRSMRHASR